MTTETTTWATPVIEELNIASGTEQNPGADGLDGESVS